MVKGRLSPSTRAAIKEEIREKQKILMDKRFEKVQQKLKTAQAKRRSLF